MTAVTQRWQELQQEVRAEAVQEGERKAKVESVARMLTRDFNVREMAEILDLELSVVTDTVIASLVQSELDAKQIAQRGPAGAFVKKPTVLTCQETCGCPLNLILIFG